jgi:hypothetical protein
MKQINYWSDILNSSDTGKKWEYNGTVYQLFIDFKQAYESVRDTYFKILSLNLVYP